MLRDVLTINTDEDIQRAFRNQNRWAFEGFDEEGRRIDIKYKRKTRNPHTNHVIVSVPLKYGGEHWSWSGVHIDLQRIRVADQSPTRAVYALPGLRARQDCPVRGRWDALARSTVAYC
ncbi:hypothetical protein ACJJTC_007153 [Scirpophaga incertulas]